MKKTKVFVSDVENKKVAFLGSESGVSFGSLHQNMKTVLGDRKDLEDASLVVFTAGNLELEEKISWMKENLKEIQKGNFRGQIFIVATPVDFLTAQAEVCFPCEKGKVFGLGTAADTIYVKERLAAYFQVNPEEINAYVLGLKGKDAFIPWDQVRISGVELDTFAQMRGKFHYKEVLEEIESVVREGNVGADLITKTVGTICKAIISNSKKVFTLSSLAKGEYGVENQAISLPCLIGKDGIEFKVPLDLSPADMKRLTNQ